jgi:GNAT superfamily N-acetyltransferase
MQTPEYTVSTDQSRLNNDLIYNFLNTQSYWAKGIPIETFERSIQNALCFGVYHNNDQVAFARVVTDRATIAYLGDVFVLPEHRGKGISKLLLKTIHAHPELQGLRRWILLTADAHKLYEQAGWNTIKKPELWMELHNPDPYNQNN